MKPNSEFTILVVDDDMINVRRAEFVLKKHGYQIEKKYSGPECLAYLETNPADLILLDIYMPKMDGFEVLAKLKENPATKNIPVIMLTGESSVESEVNGFRAGAIDFIVKPFVEDIVVQRVGRTLEYAQLRTELRNHNQSLEQEVAKQTAHIRQMHDKMILGMAEMVEGRDPNTGGHIKRTSDVVEIFVRRLRASMPERGDAFWDNVIKAAPLHDLGKITIEDRILRKPGKYDENDYAAMKCHSEQGATIIAKIIDQNEDEDFYRIAINTAHFHHEKYDGTGYPEGRKGENIPFEARIMALADVFDALVSKRCYKEPYSYPKAFQIIEESAGTHFDPVLAQLFLECREDLVAYYDEQAGYSGIMPAGARADLSGHVISPQEFGSLIESLQNGTAYQGTYHSEFHEFQRIFTYVKSIGERNHQTIQLLLLTLSEEAGHGAGLEAGMNYLEKAINGALRRVDVSMRISRSQFAILLVNLEDSNVEMVVGRIKNMFQALYTNQEQMLSHLVYRV